MPLDDNPYNDTWKEAFCFAVGFLLIMCGVVGPLMGALTFPGDWVEKLVVLLIACAIIFLGALIMRFSAWLRNRRLRF